MNEIIQTLAELNTVSIFIRMLFATICGGIIGFERGRKNRPAGLRTHILVCLGSALVMMISEYIQQTMNVNADPARLGAQVISGIGFLGAGTIIVTSRHQVRGLTTAAGLWVSACLGLAVGIGFYKGALLSLVMLLIIMTFLDKFSKYLVKSSKYLTLYIEVENISDIKTFLASIHEMNITVTDMEISRNVPSQTGSSCAVIILEIIMKKRGDHANLLVEISKLPEVSYVDEIG